MKDWIQRREDPGVATQKRHVDLLRYLDFKDGHSILELAEKWQVDPETMLRSVRQGQRMHEGQQLMILRQLKYEGALATERMRNQVRDWAEDPKDTAEPANKIIQTLQLLRKGERPVISEVGGVKTIEYATDPDVLVMFLKEVRELTSMTEKPSPNQTTVNIQQNNGSGEGGSAENSYEERLARIKGQQRANMTARVIESTAERVTPVEAELIEPDNPNPKPPEGEWNF